MADVAWDAQTVDDEVSSYSQSLGELAESISMLSDSVARDGRMAVAEFEDRLAELGAGCPPELIEAREQMVSEGRKVFGSLDSVFSECEAALRDSLASDDMMRNERFSN